MSITSFRVVLPRVVPRLPSPRTAFTTSDAAVERRRRIPRLCSFARGAEGTSTALTAMKGPEGQDPGAHGQPAKVVSTAYGSQMPRFHTPLLSPTCRISRLLRKQHPAEGRHHTASRNACRRSFEYVVDDLCDLAIGMADRLDRLSRRRLDHTPAACGSDHCSHHPAHSGQKSSLISPSRPRKAIIIGLRPGLVHRPGEANRRAGAARPHAPGADKSGSSIRSVSCRRLSPLPAFAQADALSAACRGARHPCGRCRRRPSHSARRAARPR